VDRIDVLNNINDFFKFCLVLEGASASGVCPNDLSGSGNVMGSSCYEFVANEMTWVKALSHCHSRGGRLASVTSADLQRWISLQAETLFMGYERVWIGLNDRENEGSFVWDNYDRRPGYWTAIARDTIFSSSYHFSSACCSCSSFFSLFLFFRRASFSPLLHLAHPLHPNASLPLPPALLLHLSSSSS